MATEIKYKNRMGETISPQQNSLLQGDYSHELYIDGFLKKVDVYEDNQLDNGEYYLSEDENIQSVIQDFQQVWNSGVFLTNKQQQGDYTLWDWVIYKKTEKLEQGKRLLDDSGRVIAEQYIEPLTQETLYTNKYYYLENTGNFFNPGYIVQYGTLEFTYNLGRPGEISVLINLTDFENEDYYITSEENILNHPMISPLFSWQNETYYHTDQLLPI